MINTKYPNIPDGFADAIRAARNEKKLSLVVVSKAIGYNAPSQLSRMETGRQNISYETAVKIRDFLEMDFNLPEPNFTDAPKITRKKKRHVIIKDAFYVVIDGELIKVLSYRRLGPVKKGTKSQ